MSYESLEPSLLAIYAKVDPKIEVILNYLPTALSEFPTLFAVMDSFVRTDSGGVVAMTYQVMARLCFRWQETEEAEREIRQFINAFPATITANAGLNGALQYGGLAQVTNGVVVLAPVGGASYRAIDFTIRILEKGPRTSGV